MKYVFAEDPLIEYPHRIMIEGSEVYDFFSPNTTPDLHELRSEILHWLETLQPIKRSFWQIILFKKPKQPWEIGYRYFDKDIQSLFTGKYKPSQDLSMAFLKFVRKEDAMMFKIVWS